MSEDKLKILEGTGFNTLWKWRKVYLEVIRRRDELQEEYDSQTHTQRAFSSPPYQLGLLKDILAVVTKVKDNE